MQEPNILKADLTLHWIFTAMMLCLLIAYNILCHTLGDELQINIVEDQRVVIRTIFYVFAIILFPVVNVIRHILLRLNQTMPGNGSAKKRYFFTVSVTLIIIESVGLLGFVMFILGDEFNTLYIFSILAVLGVFIHRPNMEEYEPIVDVLNNRQ